MNQMRNIRRENMKGFKFSKETLTDLSEDSPPGKDHPSYGKVCIYFFHHFVSDRKTRSVLQNYYPLGSYHFFVQEKGTFSMRGFTTGCSEVQGQFKGIGTFEVLIGLLLCRHLYLFEPSCYQLVYIYTSTHLQACTYC